jgi:hypothetical protein
MSINSLANQAAARRPDLAPLGTTPQGLEEIAMAAGTSPTTGTQPPRPGTPGQSSAQVDTALNVLFGYIPTEIITLYVAVFAALTPPSGQALAGQAMRVTPAQWFTFWTFLVATPIVVWLVYAAKIRAAQRPLPLAIGAMPLWEMFAAGVAYFAWAMALPNTPFMMYGWYSPAVSGVVVLVTSTLLGLLAPFFQRPLNV